jgi:hypothetical protein
MIFDRFGSLIVAIKAIIEKEGNYREREYSNAMERRD